MRRPKLLDLFCCAGGASMGYYNAGFDIVGLDNETQPRYPFEFIYGDAIKAMQLLLSNQKLTVQGLNGKQYGINDFNAFHASPPCQGYSTTKNCSEVFGFQKHPLYLREVRELLEATGKPYVIENVMNAKYKKGRQEDGLQAGFLCGTMFGLPFYRHRLFETSFPWFQPGHPKHRLKDAGSYGAGVKSASMTLMHNLKIVRDSAAKYFKTEWMNGDELSEAIPVAYTEYIGGCLMNEIKGI